MIKEKIIVTGNVTLEWLDEQGMYNFHKGQIGVPIDVGDLAKGLRWVDVANLKDPDFDILEQFHEMRTK